MQIEEAVDLQKRAKLHAESEIIFVLYSSLTEVGFSSEQAMQIILKLI